MYIEAGINGKNTICLIDTGSSRNLVDFEFLKAVIGPNIKLENIELGLKGISGNTVKSLGITRKIEASIENQRTYTKFISLIKAGNCDTRKPLDDYELSDVPVNIYGPLQTLTQFRNANFPKEW